MKIKKYLQNLLGTQRQFYSIMCMNNISREIIPQHCPLGTSLLPWFPHTPLDLWPLWPRAHSKILLRLSIKFIVHLNLYFVLDWVCPGTICRLCVPWGLLYCPIFMSGSDTHTQGKERGQQVQGAGLTHDWQADWFLLNVSLDNYQNLSVSVTPLRQQSGLTRYCSVFSFPAFFDTQTYNIYNKIVIEPTADHYRNPQTWSYAFHY